MKPGGRGHAALFGLGTTGRREDSPTKQSDRGGGVLPPQPWLPDATLPTLVPIPDPPETCLLAASLV
jgi:hypothetical protein